MLFPSESQIEIVGGREVANPVGAARIAMFQLEAELTRRRLAQAGVAMHEAIEAALRRR